MEEKKTERNAVTKTKDRKKKKEIERKNELRRE